MKILILSIYSESDKEKYVEMLEIQRTYIHKFNNVNAYFVTYRETNVNEVEIEDDFVYVKGAESYLGILKKTIDALEYIFKLNDTFDYVIRTNVSTILNIPKIYEYCELLPKENVYTSCTMRKLNWLDPRGGITEEKLFGTMYATGSRIIMSNDVVKNILKNKEILRYDIVDDVSIGIYINSYLPIVIKNNEKINKGTCYKTEEDETMTIDDINNSMMFFQNKTLGNRSEDIINMKKICDFLYNNNDSKENFTTDHYSFIYSFVLILLLFFFIVIFKLKKKIHQDFIKIVCYILILFFVFLFFILYFHFFL
jgi:hypothetical protein